MLSTGREIDNRVMLNKKGDCFYNILDEKKQSFFVKNDKNNYENITQSGIIYKSLL